MCAKEIVSPAKSSNDMYQELVKFAVFAVPTIIIVLHLWRVNKERQLATPVAETNADAGTKSLLV